MPFTAFTETTAPVANTTAGRYTKSGGTRGVVMVSNNTGVTLKILPFESGATYSAATTSDFAVLVPTGQSVPLVGTALGLLDLSELSIWIDTGGTTELTVMWS